jgi:hypothetical protein
MLKKQVMLHNLQIQKAKDTFKDTLSPQALMIISNMQQIIDELIKENQELEAIINEDNENMVGII